MDRHARPGEDAAAAQRRLYREATDPLARLCPRCGAAPDRRCRTPNGRPRSPHIVR